MNTNVWVEVFTQIEAEMEAEENPPTTQSQNIPVMKRMDQYVRNAHAERSASSRSRPVGDQSTARNLGIVGDITGIDNNPP